MISRRPFVLLSRLAGRLRNGDGDQAFLEAAVLLVVTLTLAAGLDQHAILAPLASDPPFHLLRSGLYNRTVELKVDGAPPEIENDG